MSEATDIITRVDEHTATDVNYKETLVWRDGTAMSDAKCDGVIYKKKGLLYYVLANFIAGEPLNIRLFGAKGDGVTDDTVAFQKASQYANIIVGPGVYVITESLTPRSNQRWTGFSPSGYAADALKASTIKVVGANSLFLYDSATNGGILYNFCFSGFAFDFNSCTAAAGINLKGFQYCKFENSRIDGSAEVAMQWQFAYFNSLTNVRFSNCNKSLRLTGVASVSDCNMNTFINTTITGWGEYGMRIENSRGNKMLQMDAETAKVSGFGPALEIVDGSYNNVDGFWYEAGNADASVTEAALVIRGIASSSDTKGNAVNFAQQIIHPNLGIRVYRTQNTRLDKVRIVDATIGVDESENTNLHIIDPVGDNVTTMVAVGSNDTIITTAGGTNKKRRISSSNVIEDDIQGGFANYKIRKAGADVLSLGVDNSVDSISSLTTKRGLLLREVIGPTTGVTNGYIEVIRGLRIAFTNVPNDIPSNFLFNHASYGICYKRADAGVIPLALKGNTTANRPVLTAAAIGAMFFDTTLTKPIWWTGTAWVDATGTTV